MIVVTGASGKTGSKAAEVLLSKNSRIRVIGRSSDHLESLGKKGAIIMTGDLGDKAFLTKALRGTDAVYLLVPPKMDMEDPVAYYNAMGDVAVASIKKAKVKKVVFLSSLGAQLAHGTGPIVGLHDVEQKLQTLKNIDLVIIRAGYFMENLLMNVGLIKSQKINGNAISPGAPIQMIAAADIGAKAAELLLNPDVKGHSVVELFGARISMDEATKIIGEKIGIPELRYVQFSAHDSINAMTGMGVAKGMAQGFVEMSNAISEGKIAPLISDPSRPTARTGFEKFVSEVFVPAWSAA